MHTYNPTNWKNAPDHKTTPINADNLNNIEQGLANAYADIAEVAGDVEDLDADKTEKTDIAPVEATNVASRTYAIGDHFYLNGQLVKATAAIAQGATIIINGNCVVEGNITTIIKTAIATVTDLVNRSVGGEYTRAFCRSRPYDDADYTYLSGGQDITTGNVYLQSISLTNGAINDELNVNFDGNNFSLTGVKDFITKNIAVAEIPSITSVLTNSKSIPSSTPVAICSFTTPTAFKYVDVTFDIHIATSTGWSEFYLLKHMNASDSNVIVTAVQNNEIRPAGTNGIHLGLSYSGVLDSALDYFILFGVGTDSKTTTTDYQVVSSNVQWVAA